jgi:hypothetical protein
MADPAGSGPVRAQIIPGPKTLLPCVGPTDVKGSAVQACIGVNGPPARNSKIGSATHDITWNAVRVSPLNRQS